jgi:hypothetical protein
MFDKHQGIEEPDEPKGSCPVLKSSGVGDCFTDFNKGVAPTSWRESGLKR